MAEELNLQTESDVEQKFVMPLLSSPSPRGLNFPISLIKTKHDIRKYKIDKGSKEKYYFPDYILLSNSLPTIIVEVKEPTEDIIEAYREARLYASEINASYGAGLNPAKYIIATNGNKTLAGFWDSTDPKVKFDIQDCYPGHPHFTDFIDTFNFANVSEYTHLIQKKLRNDVRFQKPSFLLGGIVSRNQAVGENSFGINISLDYQYLFNASDEIDREKIIKHAYVESKRRLSHVIPIDKLIRSIVTPSKQNSTEFSDTSKPTELFNKFENVAKLRNQVCLLVGSVGSGKSTFVDYIQTQALEEEILNKTHWIRLNLNNAPLEKNLLYEWVLNHIQQGIKSHHKHLDFDEFNFIQEVLWQEIRQFKKGSVTLFGEGSPEYNAELFKEINKHTSNLNFYLNKIINHLYSGRGILPIIAFDNCDKRNRDHQLLLFEVANWVRDTFSCMVFLPIRETTYEIYKDEPPLDTVIKDLVFRIDPPLLISVIQKRIDYALREIENDTSDFYYFLDNGTKIKCKRTEVGNYLRCVLNTIFNNDYFKRLIIGITGRNIRKGLEMFLDVCKSGHLPEELIFKMRTIPVKTQIPNFIISDILFRNTGRFYNETKSRIKNIFACNADDTIPDPYVRFSILTWLKERQRVFGPTKIKGYHRISDLINELTSYGHDNEVIKREVEFLLFNDYLISETQEHEFNPDNLICITSAGVVLYDLLTRLDYLAAIAEDTFFRDLEPAMKIKENMIAKKTTTQVNKSRAYENAKLLVNYLIQYKENYWINTSAYNNEKHDVTLTILKECKESLDRVKELDKDYIDYDSLQLLYPPGTEVDAVIDHITTYGVFLTFGSDGKGLLHISDNPTLVDKLNYLEVGDWLKVKVDDFNSEHKRFKILIA